MSEEFEKWWSEAGNAYPGSLLIAAAAWQASRKQVLEEAASKIEQMNGEIGWLDCGDAMDAIRSIL